MDLRHYYGIHFLMSSTIFYRTRILGQQGDSVLRKIFLSSGSLVQQRIYTPEEKHPSLIFVIWDKSWDQLTMEEWAEVVIKETSYSPLSPGPK